MNGCLVKHPFVMPSTYKIPESVLVVIYTPALDVLLIKRADAPDFWQSVTGSKDTMDETFEQTAVREVQEETGIDCGPADLAFANMLAGTAGQPLHTPVPENMPPG